MADRQRIVVVGNGMGGHRLLRTLVDRGVAADCEVTVFAEEPRPAYDRVYLSTFFDGKTAEDLSLCQPGQYEAAGFQLVLGDKATSIDRAAKTVTTASGRSIAYDKLVLATGSYPFVPPIPGADAPGSFVYRTIEDLEAIRTWSRTARTGVVIGGGLLGLEAANALVNLGLTAHVIEFAPRLMALQLDEAGGSILRRRIEALGVGVHTAKSTSQIELKTDASGRQVVAGLAFADG